MGERRDGVHAAFAGFILVFIYVTREAPEGLGVVFLFGACSGKPVGG